METPMVRPGLVSNPDSKRRVVAFFRNGAGGNLAIQMVTQLGVPADRLGVTPPEQIENGQGMILSIACPTDAIKMAQTFEHSVFDRSQLTKILNKPDSKIREGIE